MERASCAYRAGYWHAECHKAPRDYTNFNPVEEANTGYGCNPFANFDYAEGYKAGANDSWWRAFRCANGYRSTEPPYFMPGGAP